MYSSYNSDNPMLSIESDECLTRGICSVNPTLSSIQEIVVLYLKKLSFYVLKLKNFGITNEQIKGDIVENFFNIVTNIEYNQDQFHDAISKLYDYILQSKALYEKYCIEHDLEIETQKFYFKYSKHFDLTDAIRKGEKYFIKKSQNLLPEQKNMYDIMLFLCKSLLIKIIETKRLGVDSEDAVYMLLKLLDSINPGEYQKEDAKNVIQDAITIYYETIRNLHFAQMDRYGQMEPVEVSFSSEIGKAILVSGSDLAKLEKVLEQTKNTQIKVYTHGIEMLVAHSFPKFRSYSNLVGHFGSGVESSLIDFMSFPGSILMTRGSLQRVEYLYRGRLFTLDPIAPPGVIKLKDNNFEPLIKSALDAKGFTKKIDRPAIKVGFKDNELFGVVDKVIDKVISGEIKHVYIIGVLNYLNVNTKYFEDFLKNRPSDCFVFSLSYKAEGENIFYLDAFYDYSLIYKMLKRIEDRKPLNEINMSIFLTKCDKHTISNLLYLKQAGIRNVYMCKCPPTLLSPAIIQTLQDVFGVKEMTNAKQDIDDTLTE